MGVNWMPVPGVPGRFVSVPGDLVHDCRPGLTCDSWICRFKDGAKICAISGRFLSQEGDVSPRKRVIESALEAEGDEDAKRHQDRAVENSTAALLARGDQAMDVELMSSSPPVSLRSYNPRPHDSYSPASMSVEMRSWATSFDAA